MHIYTIKILILNTNSQAYEFKSAELQDYKISFPTNMLNVPTNLDYCILIDHSS